MNDGPTEQKNDRMLDLSTNKGAWFLGTDVSMRKELWHVRPPVWISHAWLKVVQRWFGSACKLRGDQLGTLSGERTCIFSSSFWPYFWIQTEDIGRVELLNYATYSVRSKLCYELRLCTVWFLSGTLSARNWSTMSMANAQLRFLPKQWLIPGE